MLTPAFLREFIHNDADDTKRNTILGGAAAAGLATAGALMLRRRRRPRLAAAKPKALKQQLALPPARSPKPKMKRTGTRMRTKPKFGKSKFSQANRTWVF